MAFIKRWPSYRVTTIVKFHCIMYIQWNLHNERIGTANLFHYLEVFFIERYNIDEYANGT